jgi:hypothetical protein
MKFTKIIFALSLFFCSCKSQNCSELINEFKNYDEAKVLVQKTNFSFTETLNAEKSSWIKSGKYLSCDSKIGFILYKTDKETYIHQNVPIEIWNELKLASSIGTYYNRNIKHKYQLNIKK